MDDRFTRIKELGRGSFGSAVLCRSKEDGKQYVIKVVDLGDMPKAEREAAHQEAQLLMALDHPNVVRCYEAFVAEGRLHIVMDHCSEGDLAAILKRRCGQPLPEGALLDLFVQMCLALKHVHDRKILHRDVKGQNVLMTSGGILKLGDFGVSKVLGGTASLAATAVGTPYYISPEICLGRKYSFKAGSAAFFGGTDVWSAGCVLYEMAAMRPPFEAPSLRALISKIIKGSYTPLPARCSSELRSLVAALLTLDPIRRPSIHEVLATPIIKARISRFLSETLQVGAWLRPGRAKCPVGAG